MLRNIVDLKNDIKNGMSEPTNDIVDTKEHELFDYEKVILTVFGWIPLGVGYYYIIRFIVNLF